MTFEQIMMSNMKWDPNDANAAAGSKPCCGGGYGTKMPMYKNGKWHDSDCSEMYPSVDVEKLQKEVDAIFGTAPEFKNGPRCECGADTVYGPGNIMHSATMPCPLYRKA